MLITLPSRIKPARGFSHLVHVGLLASLPVLAYILVRINFVAVAIGLVLISKWRIVAVRPRYWVANIVANGVDIVVGLSLVLFMSNTSVTWWQLFWMALYIAWLTWLKPRSDVLSVSAQAMVGQLLGLAVLYLKFGDASLAGLVAGTWLVTYLAARHFLTSFEEPHTALLAHVWAFFSASLAFVLSHWLLFYGTIAQIIVFLTTIGYCLAALYYLDATERLTPSLQRQMLGIMSAILVIAVVLSDWTGSTV
ncbi:MAG: hypothetical protein UY42_C0028G0005 [Parcubacteria group bacterium GW2011_GWA2_49_16]|nr:MAG: hypothetical protein UY42_C0028G0005 [Parcubacteria group bacterium GW2011_GWA2_49_16]